MLKSRIAADLIFDKARFSPREEDEFLQRYASKRAIPVFKVPLRPE